MSVPFFVVFLKKCIVVSYIFSVLWSGLKNINTVHIFFSQVICYIWYEYFSFLSIASCCSSRFLLMFSGLFLYILLIKHIYSWILQWKTMEHWHRDACNTCVGKTQPCMGHACNHPVWARPNISHQWVVPQLGKCAKKQHFVHMKVSFKAITFSSFTYG